MGIENRNGILSGIDNEKAKLIRQAMLDGTLTDAEAKKLGLTPEQQKYLQDAFNFGEVEIGDRLVLKNFGSKTDEHGVAWHYTQTLDRGKHQIEGSKVGYSVTEHNLNTDKVETKYYNDADEEISFSQYIDMQKNVKIFYVDGKDGYMSVKTDNKGNVLTDKDGRAQVTYYSKELIPISEDMYNKITDLKGAMYNSFDDKLTLHPSKNMDNASALDWIGAIAGSLNSCTEALVEAKQIASFNISMTSDLSDIKAQLQKLTELNEYMLDTLKQNLLYQIKNGESLEAILDAFGVNNKLLGSILNELMKGNQLLMDIRGGMETNNKQNDEILKVMVQILQKLNGIENSINALLKKFPGLEAQLNAILTAIKNNQGGTTDPTAILAMLDEVIRLLKNIDKSTAATEETTRKILAAIQKLGTDQAANFAALIEAINNNYGGHGPDYTNLLNLILAKLDKIDQHNQEGYEALLNKMDKILQAIKDHNITIDITGTVTCNCNCGHGGDDNGGHEGIINDITGLITS